MMEFFVSTMAQNAPELARRYGLGLEIADFSYAPFMDKDFETADVACRKKMEGLDRFWFHAPFAELCPAAIDPDIRAIAVKRYRQAIKISQGYGIRRMIIHGGFTPKIYFPEWFVPESVKFWKEFLREVPGDFTIALENVMEKTPEILAAVAEQVDDPRLGLCLDMGHANLTPVPLDTWLAVTSPRLRHVHLHSNDGKWDYHQNLGEGTLDAEAALEALQRLAPEVTVTVETMEPEPSVTLLAERGVLV